MKFYKTTLPLRTYSLGDKGYVVLTLISDLVNLVYRNSQFLVHEFYSKNSEPRNHL